jgi:hypothetical protein
MANYTITRIEENNQTYGCTNFSTIQEVGQIASLTPGADLDGNIQWEIIANPGYVIDVLDFKFLGGTAGNTPVKIFENVNGTVWNDLPNPVFGGAFKKVSSIKIIVTIFLSSFTEAGYTVGNGSNFVMPDSNINVNVDIQGCAKLSGEGISINLNNEEDSNTIKDIKVSEELAPMLASNYISEELHQVRGILPPQTVDSAGDGTSSFLMSYLVSAQPSYRFKSTPVLVFNDKSYHTKTFITSTKNPHSKKLDITGVRFDIYKKN